MTEKIQVDPIIDEKHKEIAVACIETMKRSLDNMNSLFAILNALTILISNEYYPKLINRIKSTIIDASQKDLIIKMDQREFCKV